MNTIIQPRPLSLLKEVRIKARSRFKRTPPWAMSSGFSGFAVIFTLLTVMGTGFTVKAQEPVKLLEFRADNLGIQTNEWGNITLWPNPVNSALDAVQGPTYDGPTLATVEINGVSHPALHFDGEQLLESPIAQIPVGSFFIVMKTTEPLPENQRVVGWGDSNVGQHGLELSPNLAGFLYAVLRNKGADGSCMDVGKPNVDYEVIGVTWGAAGTSLSRNGVVVSTKTAITSISSDPNILALRIGGPGSGNIARFRGDILELRVYDQQLVGDARSAVETELFNRYLANPQEPKELLELRADNSGIQTNETGNVILLPNAVNTALNAVLVGTNKGPTLATVEINGVSHPALHFDGEQLLESPIAQIPVGSFFIVMKTTEPLPENQRVVGWGDSNGGQHGLELSPNLAGMLYAVLRNHGADGSCMDAGKPNVDHEVIGLTWGAAGTSLSRNGVVVSTNTAITSLSSDPNILALRIGGPGSGNIARFRGDILELRVYDQQLVGDARSAVEIELFNRYLAKPPEPKKLLQFRADNPDIQTNEWGNITLWPNTTNSALDAVPGFTYDGPTLATVEINGVSHPALHFDGEQLLESPIAQIPVGSFFIVMKTTEPLPENQRVVGWGDSNGGQHGLELSPNLAGMLYAVLRNKGADGSCMDAGKPNVDYEVIGLTWGAAGTSLSRNGVVVSTKIAITSLSSDPNILALQIGGPGSGNIARFRGDILELRVYDQQLVGDARSAVETELFNQYLLGPGLFLSISRQGNNIVLSWTGAATLQSAEAVTGPWTDVAAATSPQTINASENHKFYRLRQ